DVLVSRIRPLSDRDAVQMDSLVGWLQTTLGVLQSTVGSADFLEKATRALVQIVGLHSGRALLVEDGEWAVAAVCDAAGGGCRAAAPSGQVLERVRREKRTFWQHPADAGDADSLQCLQAVVAAPVLDAGGRVIGALYGERRHEAGGQPRAIRKVEAMLVE